MSNKPIKQPIYLDYMATTPVDPRVAEKMAQCLTMSGAFGNPASSTHCYGCDAKQAVEHARSQVAALINADPKEIIWTSGATESDNLAITGASRFYARKGKHIVTSQTEHKAVLDTCKQLETEGFEITYLKPKCNGLVCLDDLAASIRPDTILISIMHVNNEIGVIHDINAIGDLAHKHGILLHVDAAQSAGKIAINVRELPVDLMSFSAHKIYGPKGIGALYVCRQPRIRLQPLIHGGGHENGLRSGTLATHQIVGMGEAFAIATAELDKDHQHISSLRNRFWQAIKDVPGLQLNGCGQIRVPGNFNLSFAGIEGESLLLSLQDLAISSSSACTSASNEPSYVLRALDVPQDLAYNAIRISFGRFTTSDEVDIAAKILQEKVQKLRNISPLD